MGRWNAGQNARGSGRRYTFEQRAYLLPRWKVWLEGVSKRHPLVTSARLAKRLGLRERDVRAWIDERRVVSAANAFRVGEVLRRDFDCPWSSGIVALYAAGHVSETIGVLATLLKVATIQEKTADGGSRLKAPDVALRVTIYILALPAIEAKAPEELELALQWCAIAAGSQTVRSLAPVLSKKHLLDVGPLFDETWAAYWSGRQGTTQHWADEFQLAYHIAQLGWKWRNVSWSALGAWLSSDDDEDIDETVDARLHNARAALLKKGRNP